MKDILTVKNLTFSYRDAPALHKVSFSLAEGDFLGIIGENGTGKTTLLEYLTTFDDVPLSDEQRPEYQPFRRNQNELRSFIAVYLDHEDDSHRIINITNNTLLFSLID